MFVMFRLPLLKTILKSKCFVLSDVDECLVDTGGCSMDCVNLHGTFQCTCVEGYVSVGGNSSQCRGK